MELGCPALPCRRTRKFQVCWIQPKKKKKKRWISRKTSSPTACNRYWPSRTRVGAARPIPSCPSGQASRALEERKLRQPTPRAETVPSRAGSTSPSHTTRHQIELEAERKGAMERLQRIFGASGMGQPPTDSPLLDSSEQVYISSLALLKMLKHGAHATPPPP
jgi:hypothetical protein